MSEEMQTETPQPAPEAPAFEVTAAEPEAVRAPEPVAEPEAVPEATAVPEVAAGEAESAAPAAEASPAVAPAAPRGDRPPREPRTDRGGRNDRPGGRDRDRQAQQPNAGGPNKGGGNDRRPDSRGGGPGNDRPRDGGRGDGGRGDRDRDRDRRPEARRPEGPVDIEYDKLISDSLYLDNQAHVLVARLRDLDAGTRSQLRRLYGAVRRACRAPEADRQHQFVMLRARLAYTIARHGLRSLDPLEKLLLQVTRRNETRGYDRFRDLFEAIIAYNE